MFQRVSAPPADHVISAEFDVIFDEDNPDTISYEI